MRPIPRPRCATSCGFARCGSRSTSGSRPARCRSALGPAWNRQAARTEAAFFAETPGQALTYQVGKTQLIALIADAVRVQGADLDLQALHDAVWVNGNVPIALLRWELLGLTDELAALDTAPG